MFERALNHLTGMNEVNTRTQSACRNLIEGSVFRACARKFDVEIRIDADARKRIPSSGPAIVVANHPTGFAEGIGLPALLDEIRDDVKCLGHVWFERWPRLAERMFLVDPTGEGSRDKNSAALRAAIEWVRDGHMLVLFPAAKVARGRWSGGVEEAEWRGGLLQLARRTGAPILPVSIQAEPGRAYRWASALHPVLGIATLCRELLGRAHRPISAVVHESMDLRGAGRDALTCLRQRVVEAAAPDRGTDPIQESASVRPSARHIFSAEPEVSDGRLMLGELAGPSDPARSPSGHGPGSLTASRPHRPLLPGRREHNANSWSPGACMPIRIFLVATALLVGGVIVASAQDLRYSGTPGATPQTIYAGETVTIDFTPRNTDKDFAAGPFRVGVYLNDHPPSVDPGPCGPGGNTPLCLKGSVAFAGLAPETIAPLTTVDVTLDEPGTYIFQVWVDDLEQVAETNEGNNWSSAGAALTVEVQPSVDVRIVQAYADNDTIVFGDPLGITAHVDNVGIATATNVWLELFDAGISIQQDNVAAEIAPGVTDTFLVNLTTLSVGLHELSARVLVNEFDVDASNDSLGVGTVTVLDAPPPSQVYVDHDAVLGNNNGSSWGDAFLELTDALTTGSPEIWVAEGTYKPTMGSSRGAAFTLYDGVAVYGGFAGTETLLGQRDPAVHTTTLSGDIGAVGVVGDNSLHVVRMDSPAGSALLSGVHVRDGNANGSGNDALGGGILVSAGANLAIDQARFLGNFAIDAGSAAYYNGGTHSFDEVRFTNNEIDDTDLSFAPGGALCLEGAAVATLFNVEFRANISRWSVPGLYVGASASAVLINPIVAENINWFDGTSAIRSLGSLTMTNGTVTENLVSGDGSGSHVWVDVGSIHNSIVYNNNYPGGADQLSGVVDVYDSLVEGSGGSAAWSLVGPVDRGGNIELDPLFVSPPVDLRIALGSPARNQGNNLAPFLGATDFDGNPRIFGPTVDMGAYELQEEPEVPIPLIRVERESFGLSDPGGRICKTAKAAGDTIVLLVDDFEVDLGWTAVGISDPGHTFGKRWHGATLAEPTPCSSNESWMWGFVDDGVVVPGTGGTPCTKWCYGPSGWVVPGTGGVLGGEGFASGVVSPAIPWSVVEPVPGSTNGAFLEYDVWRHLPRESGIAYGWSIRSSNDGGSTWGDWADRGELFMTRGQEREWYRAHHQIGDLVPAGTTHLQVRLSVHDVSDQLGVAGTDRTPSPFFDNVRVARFVTPDAMIRLDEASLFQDAFPPVGNLDLSTQASRDLLDVPLRTLAAYGADRFDGNNGDWTNDSLVVHVETMRTGVAISSPSQIRLVWRLIKNPVFEDAIRSLPSRAKDVSVVATAAGVWDGEVLAEVSTRGDGSVVADHYFFDLPSTDFVYPGDRLHYYIEVIDDEGWETTFPAEIPSVFAGASPDPCPEVGVACPEVAGMTMAGLGSLSGACCPPGDPSCYFGPGFLVIMAGGPETLSALRHSLAQIGLAELRDYEVFRVRGAGLGLGNGISSVGRFGASNAQLDQYHTILYAAGNRGADLFSRGTPPDGDLVSDIAALQVWRDRAGDRSLVLMGDNLASGGGDCIGWCAQAEDLRPLADGQLSPGVGPTGANPAFLTQFSLLGGCDGLRTFDALAPGSGAVATHSVLQRDGTPYPSLAGGVLLDTMDGVDRKVTMVFPFDLSRVLTEEGSSGAARSQFLSEVLGVAGTPVTAGVPTGTPRSPDWRLRVRPPVPNPFNPSTRIELELSRPERVEIVVYDVRGRHVKTLLDDSLEAGSHTVVWSGDDENRAVVSSGVYFFAVKGAGSETVFRAALVK